MAVKTNPKGVMYIEEDGKVVRKTCGKCGEMKSIDDFHKHKKYFAKRHFNCKECVLVECKLRRQEKPEVFRQRDKKYYEANTQKISERMKKYRIVNRDTLILKDRKYRETNLEKAREKDRRYYRANKDKIFARRKLSRSKNPFPDRARLQRRRARELSLPNDITSEQLREIKDFFGGCALTGSSDYHMDHVIPLAVGHGGSTLGNLIPLRSDLNINKKDKNIFEWFNEAEHMYGLDRDKFNSVIQYLANINEMTPEEYKEYVYQCCENPNILIETGLEGS